MHNEQSAMGSLLSIPGVNVQKGISMTGGTLAAYRKVLALFCKDAEDRLPLLQKTPEADAMLAFITHVHALKSALASLGAEEIAAGAAEFEAAGKAADMAFIREHLPSFAQQLAELVLSIKEALKTIEPENPPAPSSQADHSSLLIEHASLFKELAEALKKRNSADIDRIISALGEYPLDIKIKEALEKISDDVLMTEFESALKTIDEVLRT